MLKRHHQAAVLAAIALVWSGVLQEPAHSHEPTATKNRGVLFREAFDDARLAERGWYDGRRFKIVGGAYAGDGCIEYHWRAGTTTPDSSSGVRRLFEPTETVYVRFYIRLSKGTDVVFRSTDFPQMQFNQFLLTPYFGDGLLPQEQTLWMDELVVGREKPSS